MSPNFDIGFESELIGFGKITANQNAVKFETTNEKTIGSDTPSSDLDQNSGL